MSAIEVRVRLMTLEYAAKELGMSEDWLSQLAQDGKIPSTKFNGGNGRPQNGHHKGKRFFLSSDVEQFKQKRNGH